MFGPKSSYANGLDLLRYVKIWIYFHMFSENLLNLRLPSSKRRMLNAKEVQSLSDPEWSFHSECWPGESYLPLSRALTVTFFPWERGSSFDIAGKQSCSSQCRKPVWGWIDFPKPAGSLAGPEHWHYITSCPWLSASPPSNCVKCSDQIVCL